MGFIITPIFINSISIPLYIVIILYNIICMLLITLVIASITLIERKVLSLIQRRVGPYYVGYRGRLQYIADALKLFIKGIVVPEGSNKFWFVAMPSTAGAICYTFWINSMWGPSVSIFEIEYNMVYATILSILFSYCIMLTGYFSKSKYAFMASIRCAILMLNIEIFLGLLTINLIFITESFCFSIFVIYQEVIWLIFIFFGISGLIFIVFLLETNRAPFDLAEAESELVTGYSVEYGGFYFALYYLGEYFHLFFFSMVISLVLFGGWELPYFILYFINIDFNLIFIDEISTLNLIKNDISSKIDMLKRKLYNMWFTFYVDMLIFRGDMWWYWCKLEEYISDKTNINKTLDTLMLKKKKIIKNDNDDDGGDEGGDDIV